MRVVDMHCDTISGLFGDRRSGKKGSLRENGGHVDLGRLCEWVFGAEFCFVCEYGESGGSLGAGVGAFGIV